MVYAWRLYITSKVHCRDLQQLPKKHLAFDNKCLNYVIPQERAHSASRLIQLMGRCTPLIAVNYSVIPVNYTNWCWYLGLLHLQLKCQCKDSSPYQVYIQHGVTFLYRFIIWLRGLRRIVWLFWFSVVCQISVSRLITGQLGDWPRSSVNVCGCTFLMTQYWLMMWCDVGGVCMCLVQDQLVCGN